jgi:hypothetical protein
MEDPLQPIAMVLGAFAPLVAKCIFEHVKLRGVGALLAPWTRTSRPCCV